MDREVRWDGEAEARHNEGGWDAGGSGGERSARVGGGDNKGDGRASQSCGYRMPGQPLLNRRRGGGVYCGPDGLFARRRPGPIRGRPAVRGKGTTRGPHTDISNTPLKPHPHPPTPACPCHACSHNSDRCCQTPHGYPATEPPMIARGLWSNTCGGCVDRPWAPEASCGDVRVRRGSGTQRATTRAPPASCGTAWLANKGKAPPTTPGVGSTKDNGVGEKDSVDRTIHQSL